MLKVHRASVAFGLALSIALAADAGTPPAGAPPSATPPEIAYVAPRQVLTLLSQPHSGATAIGSVASGDALTVSARQGDFVQVRSAGGTSGWVRGANLTADAPTTPSQLEADNARLAEQVTTLDAQVRAFQDESAQLRTRLDAAETELAVHTRAVPLTPAGLFGRVRRLAMEPAAWIGLGALALALALAFRAGLAHRDESIRRRFGGLDL